MSKKFDVTAPRILSLTPKITTRLIFQRVLNGEQLCLELTGPPAGDGKLLLDEPAVQKLIAFLHENKLVAEPREEESAYEL